MREHGGGLARQNRDYRSDLAVHPTFGVYSGTVLPNLGRTYWMYRNEEALLRNERPGRLPHKFFTLPSGSCCTSIREGRTGEDTKMGVIEPAQTERVAPIVFAPKEDGPLSFCFLSR